MGHRGHYNGDEYDAFSRRARHILRWRPGERRRIKRAYAKRLRKSAKAELWRSVVID